MAGQWAHQEVEMQVEEREEGVVAAVVAVVSVKETERIQSPLGSRRKTVIAAGMGTQSCGAAERREARAIDMCQKQAALPATCRGMRLSVSLSVCHRPSLPLFPSSLHTHTSLMKCPQRVTHTRCGDVCPQHTAPSPRFTGAHPSAFAQVKVFRKVDCFFFCSNMW